MRKFFLRAFEKDRGLEKAARDLRDGRDRDDVLEEAIRALELDPAKHTNGPEQRSAEPVSIPCGEPHPFALPGPDWGS
jgi:hypothetical protein